MTFIDPTVWSTTTVYTSTAYAATITYPGSVSNYGTTRYPTNWTIGIESYNATVTASNATATMCLYSVSGTNPADNVFDMGCGPEDAINYSSNGAAEVGNVFGPSLLLLAILGAFLNFV